MKPRLSFIVPGHVVPSERVRKIPFVRGRTPSGAVRLGVRGLTPPDSEEYMNRVALYAMQAAARVPEWVHVVTQRLPIRLHLHIVRNAWRGDWDNYAKNLADGIARSGRVFTNDNRITQALVSIETDPRAEERAEVMVETASAKLVEPLWQAMAREAGWLPPWEGRKGA